jgi:hypothetical protein
VEEEETAIRSENIQIIADQFLVRKQTDFLRRRADGVTGDLRFVIEKCIAIRAEKSVDELDEIFAVVQIIVAGFDDIFLSLFRKMGLFLVENVVGFWR